MTAASDRPHLTEIPEDTAQYRSLNGAAVVSLLLALAAPIAFFSPALWLLPWATAGLALFALGRIARDPDGQTGRKAALAGLALAVLVGVGAPVDHAIYRWKLRGEAREFAAQWFEFLRGNELFKAYELTLPPETRKPLDDALPANYPEGSEPRRDFDGYVEREAIQHLVALGKSARLEYEDTERQYENEGRDVVRQNYAVAAESPEGPQSIALTLVLERSIPKGSSRAFWRLSHLEAREKKS